MNIISFIIPIGGLAALFFATILYFTIKRQSPGNEKMQELSSAIRKGAMAFLKSEYKVLIVFVIVVASLLFIASFIEDSNIHWGTSLAFIIGAIFSAITGNIGMRMATTANARTAEGTKKALSKGLSIAFSSGAVMGMFVVGLGVLGVFSLFVLFYYYLDIGIILATNILFGFGFGASSIALFARVGGGIYTKSADVGADLVGKVEAGIPEDDPRNPAVIADQVGDNVGDVAGTGADIFDSNVAAILAASLLGAAIDVSPPYPSIVFGLLPLLIAGLGTLASVLGVFLVRPNDQDDPGPALNRGTYITTVLFASLVLIVLFILEIDLVIALSAILDYLLASSLDLHQMSSPMTKGFSASNQSRTWLKMLRRAQQI